MAHDFHGPHKSRCLPVTFCTETVSIGHQALDSDSRKLREAMQILKRIGKCVGVTFQKKVPQTRFNSCCLMQRLALVAIGSQRLCDLVRFIVFNCQPLNLCVLQFVNEPYKLSNAVSIHRVAQSDLRVDFVSLGHRNIPHVVAQASDLQVLSVMPGAGGSRPDGNIGMNTCISPGTNDYLSREPHAGSNKAILPVSMSRLV